MAFQSCSYLALLAGAAAVCPALARRSGRAARWTLLAFCVLFYLGSGARGLFVLAAGLCVTAAALRALRAGRRRAVAWAGAYHIAVLLVFKYTGFLTGGAVSVGWSPLGLSFFTFQQLWLLKESATGAFSPPDPLTADTLALHGLFFPSVSSGPILRPEAFFPQAADGHFLRPDWTDRAQGLYALCFGMAKKVLLADPLGAVVNSGYARAGELTAPAAWLVILGYTLQLYFDFSGYCDIAAGSARLLGVRLPVNFDSPYRSLSLGEFWKRWHMTLTAFLRECVYFPLGGSRGGTARTCRNILLVYLISGLWHGAGWTFLVWGALHGLGQVIERLWGRGRDRLPRWAQWALTFGFVNLAWVFFRAPDLDTAGTVLRQALLGGWGLPAWLAEDLLPSEAQALRVLGLGGRTAETLLPYENAELHCFLDDMDVILDLDNYADHIHAAGRVTYAMAEALPGGAYRLTPENARQRLDALHEFVVNYDYEPLFQP